MFKIISNHLDTYQVILILSEILGLIFKNSLQLYEKTFCTIFHLQLILWAQTLAHIHLSVHPVHQAWAASVLLLVPAFTVVQHGRPKLRLVAMSGPFSLSSFLVYLFQCVFSLTFTTGHIFFNKFPFLSCPALLIPLFGSSTGYTSNLTTCCLMALKKIECE